MFMRSCLSVSILVLGVVLLNGCGETAKTNVGGAKAGEDTLAAVKRAGVIKWGADANGGAPYVFTDKKNSDKVVGFEIDMMEKIAGHLGVKEQRDQGQWDALPESLNGRRTDIVMNGFEINDKNTKSFLFSDPYFVYVQQFVVRAEDKEKYKTMADLKGHKIGILSGTESGQVLKKAGFSDDQIVGYDDSMAPYENLKLKRVDAVLAESIINDFYAGKDNELHLVPEKFAPGRYGIMARKEKESDALLAELNRILKLMKENGELAAIYKKWNILDERQKEVGVAEK